MARPPHHKRTASLHSASPRSSYPLARPENVPKVESKLPRRTPVTAAPSRNARREVEPLPRPRCEVAHLRRAKPKASKPACCAPPCDAHGH
jgi:hypothetical protein